MRRLVLWSGIDAWRAEVAGVELGRDSMAAAGTQLGADPVTYRLDYELRTGPAFVTDVLDVAVTGEGWTRRLRLARDDDGSWTWDTEEHGEAPLPPPGGDAEEVKGALDCDLALSPLTNLMPIRRHLLHERPGHADFLMAWVSVPDLGLHPSEQRYEHVRRDAGGSVVRFVGRDPDFVAELVLDRDGFVELYPELARRVRTD
ncbi:MAG TPA: putative glycolipid-binding domain-containing protein [Acidimicrobiales bacterium]|nr:putative glycolipid-binding domain-containing protein [Acidimicrobiales bacterium]